MANEPRIVYKEPRAVYAFGHQADLNGFRYGGRYSRLANTKPMVAQRGIFQYDDYKLGFSMPSMSDDPGPDRLKNNQMWVAVFAHAWPEDRVASIGFIPFLRVSGTPSPDPDNLTTAVTFLGNVGTIVADNVFAGTDVLICQTGTNGVISNKIVKAVSNTTTTITLQGINLGLVADNYILPAPPDGRDYQYLCSLKLDWGPKDPPPPEPPTPHPEWGDWRNFVYSQRRAYSYTGQVGPSAADGGPDVTSTTYKAVDLRHNVSPLATGILGTLQAYFHPATPGPGDSAYLTVASSDDASDPATAVEGTDRLITSVSGDGGTAPFMVGFGATDSVAGPRQTLWAKVNNANVIGQIAMYGWVED